MPVLIGVSPTSFLPTHSRSRRLPARTGRASPQNTRQAVPSGGAVAKTVVRVVVTPFDRSPPSPTHLSAALRDLARKDTPNSEPDLRALLSFFALREPYRAVPVLGALPP